MQVNTPAHQATPARQDNGAGPAEQSFRTAITRLRDAAGLSAREIEAQISRGDGQRFRRSTVQAWFNNGNIPSDAAVFGAFVEALESRAERRGGGYRPLGPSHWERLRAAALAERRKRQGRGAGDPRPPEASCVPVSGTQSPTASAGGSGVVAAVCQPLPVDSWSASDLGVHKAISGATGGRFSVSGRAEEGFVLPDYVERDHDAQLRALLRNAGENAKSVFLVVLGGSCTGKSRAAYEAVRSVFGGDVDWSLVCVRTADDLVGVLAAGVGPRTVLWVADLEACLDGARGAGAAAALGRRLDQEGPLVVVATAWVWPRRWAVSGPADAVDPHCHVKELHKRVRVVDVPARFTEEQVTALRARIDPALREACVAAGDSGAITQTLAAGPDLVERYAHPDGLDGRHGAALISAAMDACRLEARGPLPEAFLEAAAGAYLDDKDRAAAGAGWFEAAMAYARVEVKGVVAPFEAVPLPGGMGASPGVVNLADFLHHHGASARAGLCPPSAFWEAALTHLSSAQLTLADAAAHRGRLRYAVALYRKHLDAAGGSDRLDLGWEFVRASHDEIVDRGAPRDWLTGSMDVRRRLRAEDPNWSDARLSVRPGELHFPSPAPSEDPDHNVMEEAQLARWRQLECVALAAARERAGDVSTAELLYGWAADAGDTLARGQLIRLRERHMTADQALELYRENRDFFSILRAVSLRAVQGHSPDAVIDKIRRRNSRATVSLPVTLHEAGLPDHADDVVRTDVPPAVQDMLWLFLAAMDLVAGRTAAARRRFEELAAAGGCVGLTARGRLRELDQDWSTAEEVYRQAVVEPTRRGLPTLRVNLHDSPRHYILDAGPTAWDHVRVCERAGDKDRARQLAVRYADSGDATALWHLAADRIRHGHQPDHAQALLDRGIEPDGTTTLTDLDPKNTTAAARRTGART